MFCCESSLDGVGPVHQVTPKFKLPVFVVEGYRPYIPPYVPVAMANLISDCWQASTHHLPPPSA